MAPIRLYHAHSSYYSMIARLALAMGEIDYESRVLDIHRRREQLTAGYGAINPFMTVPALEIGTGILTDSQTILAWVIAQRPERFIEGGEQERSLLASHAAFSVEGLTFGRTMLRFPLLRWLFPRLLKQMCASLQREKAAHPALDGVFSNKIRQNEARIRFFTEGSLAEKVAALRKAAEDFLRSVPVPTGPYLRGDRPSASDIVLLVFLARMKMIGEWPLVMIRPDLVAWFDHLASTPAFQSADIWTVFSLRRVLLGR